MKTINFIENCKLKIANYLRKGFIPPLHARAGFTLLELLVVIAIIVILAVILMPALSAAQRRAQEARTEAMIANLRLAISMFDTDTGVFPKPPPSVAITNVVVYDNLRAAAAGETIPRPTGWAGPYMEFRAEDIRGTPPGVVDFWGNPFQFQNTPPAGAPPGHLVYIWSFGSNRVNESGGGDDIRSW